MPDQVLSFTAFARKVRPADANHIWLGPLRVNHGEEKHTEKQWWALITAMKARPVVRL